MSISNLYEKHYELISYIFFGLVTTGINVLCFYSLNSLIGMSYLLANALAIIISILFAFLVNKKYVFRIKSQSTVQGFKELGLFFLFRGFSALFDMSSMWILVGMLRLNPNVSKMMTEGVVIILNFIISKFIVFKKNS